MPVPESGKNVRISDHACARTRSGGGTTWTMNWAGFDKPRWMAKTTGTTTVGSEFHYNAARSRVMQREFNAIDGSGPTQYNRKRVYALGSTLELNYTTAAPALNPTWDLMNIRIYIPGPDGIIGAREFSRPTSATSTFTEKALVYHYDHLGSITATTLHTTGALANDNDTSNPKPAKYSEDAWGQRRNPFTWSGAPVTLATDPNKSDDGSFDSATPRGYTGHEMLDDLGLVHMNGRIYDPLLGRFLSADILVQAPGNLQSYNRYTYVFNNPLRYTDSSGYTTDEEWEEMISPYRLRRQSLSGTKQTLTNVTSNVAENVVKKLTGPDENKNRLDDKSTQSTETEGEVNKDKQPPAQVTIQNNGTPPTTPVPPNDPGTASTKQRITYRVILMESEIHYEGSEPTFWQVDSEELEKELKIHTKGMDDHFDSLDELKRQAKDKHEADQKGILIVSGHGYGWPQEETMEIGAKDVPDEKIFEVAKQAGWDRADVIPTHCHGPRGALHTNAMEDANNFREAVGSNQRWERIPGTEKAKLVPVSKKP